MTNYWIKNMKKKFLPNGLVGRFLLIILLPLLIVQFSVGILFYNRHWDAISRRLAKDIVGEIEIVVNLVNNSSLPTQELNHLLKKVGDDLSLTLEWQPEAKMDMKQKKRLLDMNHSLMAELNNLNTPYLHSTSTDGEQHIQLQLSKGVLEVTVVRKRFFSTTVWVFLFWMMFSSLFWFGVALIFMKNQLRAIIRLANAAEAFGVGKNVDHFKPEGATEVRHAGTAFLMMKNRLQRYLSERTAMLAGVSHDLRTPLTRLKLQLSMLPPNPVFKDMSQDIDDMENMLNGYLTFASGEGREEAKEIELTPLMTNLIDKFNKTNHHIELKIYQNISVIGRPTDLSRALGNLIVQIIIDDNGAGIPKNKRNEDFKPFVRLDESRNPETGGVGLGLTIARDILLSHGGDIALDTSPQKGLRVVVSLPVIKTTK